MAEAKTEERAEAAATPAAPKRVEALGELVNAASALQAIQAQAAIEAMKLPEKRLDDASPEGGAPGYTLRDLGDGKTMKVDAFGDEIKGKAGDRE